MKLVFFPWDYVLKFLVLEYLFFYEMKVITDHCWVFTFLSQIRSFTILGSPYFYCLLLCEIPKIQNHITHTVSSQVRCQMSSDSLICQAVQCLKEGIEGHVPSRWAQPSPDLLHILYGGFPVHLALASDPSAWPSRSFMGQPLLPLLAYHISPCLNHWAVVTLAFCPILKTYQVLFLFQARGSGWSVSLKCFSPAVLYTRLTYHTLWKTSLPVVSLLFILLVPQVLLSWFLPLLLFFCSLVYCLFSSQKCKLYENSYFISEHCAGHKEDAPLIEQVNKWT